MTEASDTKWIVLAGQIIGGPDKRPDTVYSWNGTLHATSVEAIADGFTMGRSDDFNVAKVFYGRLVGVYWMASVEVAIHPGKLIEIEEQIGLQKHTQQLQAEAQRSEKPLRGKGPVILDDVDDPPEMVTPVVASGEAVMVPAQISESATANLAEISNSLVVAPESGEKLARRFHELYERLAPRFSYETREDTREFDPESSNGKLMLAVCAAIEWERDGERESALRELVKAINEIRNNSQGVTGWHLNGDLAEWKEYEFLTAALTRCEALTTKEKCNG